MSFDEIERVIRSKLPPSATQHRAWWSNNAQNNVMTKAWKDAGFESEDVDMKGRRVAFRRVRSETSRDTVASSVNVNEGPPPDSRLDEGNADDRRRRRPYAASRSGVG